MSVNAPAQRAPIKSPNQRQIGIHLDPNCSLDEGSPDLEGRAAYLDPRCPADILINEHRPADAPSSSTASEPPGSSSTGEQQRQQQQQTTTPITVADWCAAVVPDLDCWQQPCVAIHKPGSAVKEAKFEEHCYRAYPIAMCSIEVTVAAGASQSTEAEAAATLTDTSGAGGRLQQQRTERRPAENFGAAKWPDGTPPWVWQEPHDQLRAAAAAPVITAAMRVAAYERCGFKRLAKLLKPPESSDRAARVATDAINRALTGDGGPSDWIMRGLVKGGSVEKRSHLVEG